MSEAQEKKPAAKSATKSAAKAKTPAKAPEHAAPEAAPGGEKRPFVKKEIGGYNFEMKEVPNELKQAVQNRFGKPGVEMSMAPSRANGSYKGEVLNSDHYLAQHVGANSVVFHKKDSVELVSDRHQWADANKKLNGANLAFHYDGDKAKAFPHDPEREQLAKMVNTMAKVAENLKLPNQESFKENLGKVHDAMWEHIKDRRKQEQTKQRPQPEKQQQQEQERSH